MERILSICMPIYNGGERAKRHIKRIASILGEDVNLIISDNCSTDGMIDEIEALHNENIIIYRQSENVGTVRNAIYAMKHGTGKYVMLLLDRDILQIEYLEEYLDILRKNEYGVILNMCQFLGNEASRCLSEKDSVYYLALAPHPSFYVFLREAFNKIECSQLIYENGYYPALYGMNIKKEYPVYLNGTIPIILEAEREYILMNASRSWGNSPHTYAGGFEPDEYILRFELYINYLISIDEFNVDNVEAMLKITLKGIVPGYFECLECPMMKHRYKLLDIDYSIDEKEQLLKDSYAKIEDVVRRKGVLSEAIEGGMGKCFEEYLNSSFDGGYV